MKPEQHLTEIKLYTLATVTTNGMPHGGYGSPYSIIYGNNVYETLDDAQRAQTYEALKNGIKYHIFCLEFPLN